MRIKCFKCAVTLFFLDKSNFSLFGLSNEVLCILVPQRVAKLPAVKVGDLKKWGLEPGPHSGGADQAEGQNFFRTSNFNLWQFCSVLNYKDAYYYRLHATFEIYQGKISR